MNAATVGVTLEQMQRYNRCWFCYETDGIEPMESSAWKKQCIDRMPCIARERAKLDLLVASVRAA